MDRLCLRVANVQCRGRSSHLRFVEVAGTFALESAGLRLKRDARRPGFQHGDQLFDKHQLAIVCS